MERAARASRSCRPGEFSAIFVRSRPSRLVFAPTFLRYCSTILSPEAPAVRLAGAGLRRREDFFTDHAMGFTLGSLAAAHQLRSPITRLLSRARTIRFNSSDVPRTLVTRPLP